MKEERVNLTTKSMTSEDKLIIIVQGFDYITYVNFISFTSALIF